MKKPKELDENPISDLFHALSPERKLRETKEDESAEMDDESKELEDKKRARYEAIKKKARADFDY
jgi:hypothetical protein